MRQPDASASNPIRVRPEIATVVRPDARIDRPPSVSRRDIPAGRVSWRTGRVDLDLVSDEFHFIGGLHNLLWKGEPHRFRIETPTGAPVGDAILQPRRVAEAEAPGAQAEAP